MQAAALDIDNLPTPKDERWKYTNLQRALPAAMKREETAQVETIIIPRGQVGGKAADIVFTGVDKTLHTPQIKITVEEGAQATVIERHDGKGAYWKNAVCDITLGPGAILNHYRIFEDSADAVTTINTAIMQQRDSSYYGFYMIQKGALVRNELKAVLAGEGAHCDMAGLQLLDGKQIGDTTILIEHAAPHCTSSQFFRHVLAGESRGVFQGKVHVHQVAQKTDGYQLSNALLLSDKAEMDTKPELEIYADDVKCSHGSTLGQLDDDPLFYLRARGVPEAEARMLLVQAFLDEVCDKISDESFKARILGLCRNWLAEVL